MPNCSICCIAEATLIGETVCAECYWDDRETQKTKHAKAMEKEKNKYTLCMCCGEEFEAEKNFPGLDPKKMQFCTFQCAAKGPFVIPKGRPSLMEKTDKEEEEKTEEEEFPEEWLLM